MLNHYVNFKFLNHLNNYDLVNKFNYTNYYIIPKFNKLSLNIFLKGALNSTFLNLYLKNFLLLYLYCCNVLNTELKFKKIRHRKLKSYKVKLFLSYSFMKKKILNVIYDFFFLVKKFVRPFYFSNHNNCFSSTSGKLCSFESKIITFIPSLMLLDHKEHRIFSLFKKSKIFLVFTLKNILTTSQYNFFLLQKKSNKNILKNFLLIWYLI
jgi:hypothetical protein